MNDDRKYPDLSDTAKEKAVQVMDQFRKDLKKIADEAMDEIYVDVASHVMGDSWTNFRNSIWDYVLGYKALDKHEAKKLRDKIFAENREQILQEIGGDLAAEVASLKRHIEEYQDRRRSF